MSQHAQLPHCAQKTPEIRLSLQQKNRKLGVVVHACNPSTREKEAGGLLWAHGQSSWLREHSPSYSYIARQSHTHPKKGYVCVHVLVVITVYIIHVSILSIFTLLMKYFTLFYTVFLFLIVLGCTLRHVCEARRESRMKPHRYGGYQNSISRF